MFITVIFKEDIVAFLSFATLSAVFLRARDWEAVVLKGLEMFQYWKLVLYRCVCVCFQDITILMLISLPYATKEVVLIFLILMIL